MICEFCKKEYSSKSNLLKHQQTTVKCILLQQNCINNCKYCEYTTKKKHIFNIHIIQCSDKKIKEYKKLYDKTIHKNTLLQNTIFELKEECDKVKEEYSNLKMELKIKNQHTSFLETEYTEVKKQLYDNVQIILAKPSIINNSCITSSSLSTINKLELSLNVNNDVINQKVDDYFTLTHLTDGIKGVAKFTNDHIINKENGQSKYICSDVARTIFKYKDDNNKIQKDVKATKLKNLIKEPIITKSKQLYQDESERLLNEMTINNNRDKVAIHSLNLNNLTTNFLKVKNIEDHGDEYAKEIILVLQ